MILTAISIVIKKWWIPVINFADKSPYMELGNSNVNFLTILSMLHRKRDSVWKALFSIQDRIYWLKNSNKFCLKRDTKSNYKIYIFILWFLCLEKYTGFHLPNNISCTVVAFVSVKSTEN